MTNGRFTVVAPEPNGVKTPLAMSFTFFDLRRIFRPAAVNASLTFARPAAVKTLRTRATSTAFAFDKDAPLGTRNHSTTRVPGPGASNESANPPAFKSEPELAPVPEGVIDFVSNRLGSVVAGV